MSDSKARKMKKWNVTATIVGGQWVGVVDAATEREAKDIGEGKVNTSFCHHCSRLCEDAEASELHAEEVK